MKPIVLLCLMCASILNGCSSSEPVSDPSKLSQQQIDEYNTMIEASYDAMRVEEEMYSAEDDNLGPDESS